jgi:hypothetical protein
MTSLPASAYMATAAYRYGPRAAAIRAALRPAGATSLCCAVYELAYRAIRTAESTYLHVANTCYYMLNLVIILAD